MKTELARHQLSPNLHFRIILRRRIRSLWYLYVLCIAAGIWFLLLRPRQDDMSIFLGVVGVFYPFSTALSAWVHTHRKATRDVYLPREIYLQNNEMVVRVDEEQRSSITLKSLLRAERHTGYWLLHLNKTQYYVIPESAFRDADHEAAFAAHLGKYTTVAGR